jgi:hypothetical protein
MPSIVGDIIEIEHTADHTPQSPQWNLIGKTHDTVELSPNVEVAERRHHESKHTDKSATMEAWEISFSKDIVAGTAALEELGLLDSSSYAYQGFADTRETGNAADALMISVYENDSERQSNNPMWQVATADYLLLVDTGELAVEDYSTYEMVIHSREAPTDINAGGSL